MKSLALLVPAAPPAAAFAQESARLAETLGKAATPVIASYRALPKFGPEEAFEAALAAHGRDETRPRVRADAARKTGWRVRLAAG